MSVLNPTPAEQTAQWISSAFAGCKSTIVATWNNLEQLVWRNPHGLTPQEVFDVLGSDGAAVVAWRNWLLPALQNSPDLVNQWSDLRPPAAVVTINPDHTVTVSGV